MWLVSKASVLLSDMATNPPEPQRASRTGYYSDNRREMPSVIWKKQRAKGWMSRLMVS